MAAFEAADILLRDAGQLGHFFLGQPLRLPKSAEIHADEEPHVHAADRAAARG